jgi:hypothetical protein
MNELTGQRQAGMNNLFGGIEGMASAGMNLLGTKAGLDALKGLNPAGGGFNPLDRLNSLGIKPYNI